MHQRFWRQRRRIGFVCCIAFLSGFLLGGGLDLLLAVVSFANAAILLALSISLVPPYRHYVTSYSIILLFLSLFVFLTGLGIDPAIIFGLALGLGLILPTQISWLNKIRLPWISRSRRAHVINLPIEDTWDRIYPRQVDKHWDPALAGIIETGTKNTFDYVYTAFGYFSGYQRRMRVFDIVEGAEFKMRDLSRPTADEGGPVTVTGHYFVANPGGTLLTIDEGTWRQEAWVAFSLWMDDYLGDHLDRISALMEDRKDWSIRGDQLRRLEYRR